MNRLLALLALAALASVGCRAYPGGPGCCCGHAWPYLWGVEDGCCDECGYGEYGCEPDCGCGPDCDCGPDCGCGPGYCEPGCGCSTNCGHGPDGVCAATFADCPLCKCGCCRHAFRRYCHPPCDDACGPYYGGAYDMSACYRDCENGHGHGLCRGCCCGCCEQYSGCCCPCGNGPGCCASGDHHYTFAPGPPTGQVAYPYYTVRGPRDFLNGNPPPLGPY